MKRTVILIIAGLILAGALILLLNAFVCRIPPDAMTRTRMTVTKVRIVDYYADKGSLPRVLSDLPPGDPNKDNSTDDAWEQPIDYRVNDKKVTLMSLGADGEIGGEGMDQDIIIVFDPETSETIKESLFPSSNDPTPNEE